MLDADIRSFFDTVDHGWMQKFLEHRIGDRRLVRLLMKWLKAGVMEEGKLHETQAGTAQGAIISPLMANIYLHYVIDLWVQQWRKRSARGQVYVVRYADDLVLGFQYEEDARAMRAALAARVGPSSASSFTRTRRGCCDSGDSPGRTRRGTGVHGQRHSTFWGFTHICAEGRKGEFRLLRRTSRKKRVAKLRAVRTEVLRRICQPVIEQHAWLSSVVQGHFRYYGVPGNYRALGQLPRIRQVPLGHQRLQRRSQRAPMDRREADAVRSALSAARPTYLPPLAHDPFP